MWSFLLPLPSLLSPLSSLLSPLPSLLSPPPSSPLSSLFSPLSPISPLFSLLSSVPLSLYQFYQPALEEAFLEEDSVKSDVIRTVFKHVDNILNINQILLGGLIDK
jgi:hypothetical protein